MLTRRGFTLVEATVAAALTVLVGGLIVTLLLRGQSVVAFERNRMMTQRTLRTGALFATYEWSGFTPGGGDVMALARSWMQYRGLRGLASACAVRTSAITIRQDLRFAVRSWIPGRDSLLIYASGDSVAGTAPRWEALPLTGVTGGSCPDGSAGLLLQTLIDTLRLPGGEVLAGAPVRLFESTEARLYQSRGSWWLGLRSLTGGGAIQPALGPLTRDGFELRFHDLGGAVTTDPARVVSLSAVFRAPLLRPSAMARPAGASDSLVVELVSRNLSLTGRTP